jgi:hypothetical protein
MKRFSLLGLAGLAVLAPALTGCGSSNNTPKTRLRFIDAAVGLSNVPLTVQVNGLNIGGNLSNPAYGSETQAEVVNAGSVPVSVLQGLTSLATANLALTANVDQPVLFSGISGAAGAQALRLTALPPQDLSTTPSGRQPRIYFLNAAPDLNSVNFSYTIGSGAPQTNGSLQGIAYTTMTAPVLPDLGSGFASVTFTAAGDGQNVNSTATTLEGGKTYLALLAGRPAPNSGSQLLTLYVVQLN